MKFQIALLFIGVTLATPGYRRTTSPPARAPALGLAPSAPGRRNDYRDVPDNSGRVVPPNSPIVYGPPPPAFNKGRRGPPPPAVRNGPPPANRIAHPAPISRTKSAGFLSGPIPYVPPQEPYYPSTTYPPYPTAYYGSNDTPDVKKEEDDN